MRAILAVLVTTGISIPVTSPLVGQGNPPACQSEEHRAFDYWVGEWNVLDTAGTKIAESSIELSAAGCAIRETWRPNTGPEGVSISWFQPKDEMWHQQWVGGSGWIAWFDGGIEDGSMTLTTASDPENPTAPRFKMIYTQPRENVVRQTLYTSSDDGKNWAVNFVGEYVKRQAADG